MSTVIGETCQLYLILYEEFMILAGSKNKRKYKWGPGTFVKDGHGVDGGQWRTVGSLGVVLIKDGMSFVPFSPKIYRSVYIILQDIKPYWVPYNLWLLWGVLSLHLFWLGHFICTMCPSRLLSTYIEPLRSSLSFNQQRFIVRKIDGSTNSLKLYFSTVRIRIIIPTLNLGN